MSFQRPRNVVPLGFMRWFQKMGTVETLGSVESSTATLGQEENFAAGRRAEFRLPSQGLVSEDCLGGTVDSRHLRGRARSSSRFLKVEATACKLDDQFVLGGGGECGEVGRNFAQGQIPLPRGDESGRGKVPLGDELCRRG